MFRLWRGQPSDSCDSSSWPRIPVAPNQTARDRGHVLARSGELFFFTFLVKESNDCAQKKAVRWRGKHVWQDYETFLVRGTAAGPQAIAIAQGIGR